MAQKIVKPVTRSTADMYVFYKQKYPTSKIPYWMYKEVIARFNKKVSHAVIFGQVLNLGSKLGHLLIKKINRNYNKPVVDWGQSKALKKQLLAEGKTLWSKDNPDGEKWMVFHSDSWYLRWAWAKKYLCKVKHQGVYKFVPTSNKSKTAGDNSLDKLGNKGKLALANKLNPMLHFSYEINTQSHYGRNK
jgi:hypothetical protein